MDMSELIRPRRPNDWPIAVEGWRVVGGGRDVPGYASERSAKIAIAKEPRFKGGAIAPFRYWDGSLMGRYSDPAVRYAVLIRR